MRKLLIAAPCLLVVGTLLLDVLGVSLCFCDIPLEVTVSTNQPETVTAVAYAWEEDDAVRCFFENSRRKELIKPFSGEPFTIYVSCTRRCSVLFGRDLGYSQYRQVTIAQQRENGQRMSKTVSIPDGRVPRKLTVQLP